MKKYGLRIGDVGIEFCSIDERQKALLDFTKGCDVKIYDRGIMYKECTGTTFSVYERETKDVIVTCEVCTGVFGIESSPDREYTYKSYNGKYEKTHGCICDACLAKKIKEKEIFDAKKVLEESKDAD